MRLQRQQKPSLFSWFPQRQILCGCLRTNCTRQSARIFAWSLRGCQDCRLRSAVFTVCSRNRAAKRKPSQPFSDGDPAGLFAGRNNHSAGNSGACFSGWVGHHIVGIGMNDNRGSAVGEEGVWHVGQQRDGRQGEGDLLSSLSLTLRLMGTSPLWEPSGFLVPCFLPAGLK